MSQAESFPAYVEQLMVNWSRLAIYGARLESSFHQQIHSNTRKLLGIAVLVETISDEPGIFRLPSFDNRDIPDPREAIPWARGSFYCYVAGRHQLPRLLLTQTVDIGELPDLEVLPVNQEGKRLITIEAVD